MDTFFEKLFKLSSHKTDVRRELLAGMTTFLTMAYIIFVQPAILSRDFAGQPTGLSFEAVMLATCLISALTTIFMALYANYPIALAPGMGENFFFISVLMALTAMGMPEAWRVTLGVVFLSGVLFLVLTLLKVREAVISAVSPSMRNGIAVGIGLFITFLGFQHGGLIVAKPGTMVGLNADFISTDIAVFFFGLVVTSVLTARNVRGAILLGILAATALALALGVVRFQGVVGMPDFGQLRAFELDISRAFSLVCLPFIIVFLFMDMFDTVGTLIGVAETAGFMEDGRLPRASRVLTVDAVGTVGASCLGTSTVTSFIESITGVAAGGRTGLTSLTVGVMFIAALFFGPLIGMIGQYAPITAPALIIVGAMMIQNVKRIDWDDFSECIPAFITMVGVPFCYSIADGLALGFISYPVIKLFSGRGRQVSWLMYLLAVILLGYFLFVRSHLG